MKTKQILRLMAAIAIVLPAMALSSCNTDPDEPDVNFDSRLIGTWELAEADGQSVTGDQVDYYTFEYSGLGTYARYIGGELQKTPMTWYTYLIDAQPGLYMTNSDTGQTEAMLYTVADGRLTLTWTTVDGVTHTYIYQQVSNSENG